ncbi:hypothetical protein PUR61_18160, partial [Streptomyces sp. BE20]|uniref:hypothetical protein n=1 Tax=Streptomyces sp. BE20 TaxID=3002525 RepID=UPI002E7AADBF
MRTSPRNNGFNSPLAACDRNTPQSNRVGTNTASDEPNAASNNANASPDAIADRPPRFNRA